MKKSKGSRVHEAFELLFQHFGPQGWWPGDTALEVLVGAVLTQNTNWGNVEKAIANIKTQGVMSFDDLHALEITELAELIRPSGYYNVKAKRLHNLLQMIFDNYNGDLEFFIEEELYTARDALLEVKGVGPETADAILLYACNKPIFVVDAYTHRIFHRHNMIEEETDYHSMQELFMDGLEQNTEIYNEYHALIVRLAKEFCKKTNPICEGCPLEHL